MKNTKSQNHPDPLLNYRSKKSYLNFFTSRIQNLEKCNRLGTAHNYKRALSSLKSYIGEKDILFRDIDEKFVAGYYEWLTCRGVLRNSISFYLRILRAVYNKGIAGGYGRQRNPFASFFTGVDKTRKRAVSIDLVKQIKSLDIQPASCLDMARDIFLFSFYTRGMAFVDIAYLRKCDIVGESIRYERQKTGRQLILTLEEEAEKIIKKYADKTKDSLYLFPILHSLDDAGSYKEYRKALSCYNYRLRCLSRLLGKGIRLTSYTSRHTWATVAMDLDIPMTVISEALGHTTERTTRIYLDSLSPCKTDSANRKILDALNAPTR